MLCLHWLQPLSSVFHSALHLFLLPFCHIHATKKRTTFKWIKSAQKLKILYHFRGHLLRIIMTLCLSIKAIMSDIFCWHLISVSSLLFSASMAISFSFCIYNPPTQNPDELFVSGLLFSVVAFNDKTNQNKQTNNWKKKKKTYHLKVELILWSWFIFKVRAYFLTLLLVMFLYTFQIFFQFNNLWETCQILLHDHFYTYIYKHIFTQLKFMRKQCICMFNSSKES